ncbi:Endoribonuclease L-PSP/chorismate mutase-like protein [Tylopilus felleus]
MPKQIINDITGAVPPLPVFSQAVISNGSVYVSGSIGCDAEYNIIGGIQDQTRAALDNMKALLEGAGSGLEHVVKVTVYLANITRDFVVFNEIYAEYFPDRETLPARTCIGVAALPLGAFVEIECVAELAPRDD